MSHDQIRNYRQNSSHGIELILKEEIGKEVKDRDQGNLMEVYTQMMHEQVNIGMLDPLAAIICMQLINSSPLLELTMTDQQITDYTPAKLIDITIRSVELEQRLMKKYPDLSSGFDPETIESHRKIFIEAVESQSILVVDPNSLIHKFAQDTAKKIAVEEIFSDRSSPVELGKRLYTSTINNFYTSLEIDKLSVYSIGDKPTYFLDPKDINSKIEDLKNYRDSFTKFSTP